jgi:polyether ionophore transport system permease protein
MLMLAERVPVTDRRAAAAVAIQTARRAARSSLGWGAVFGLFVVSSVTNFTTTAKTPAARAQLAASLGAGFRALFGTSRQLDTVAGFTAWRSVGVCSLIGAVWALLLATRTLRGEEQAGRWELLLAGQTTRRGAATQAMAGLGAGLLWLWAVTAAAAVAIGATDQARFSLTASLFLATAMVASAGVFLAVGALASQLTSTRRHANALGAGVLGACFLLRMVADSDARIQWLRWASPLGWIEELHPLTGSRALALVPLVALTTGVAASAAGLAGRRDLGASTVPAGDSAPARTRLLGSPIGLALRLGQGVIIGWAAALAIGGLVGGLVAQSVSTAVNGASSINQAITRLGGHQSGAATYLGIVFPIGAALVAFAAAGQLAATRDDEAEGYADHLLVRPVSRVRWLTGRLAVSAGLVLVASLVFGLAAWAGAATQHSGIGWWQMIQAGSNIAPPSLCILGLGTLVYGLWPRLATMVGYGLVAWSFLVQLIGTVVTTNRFLLDTSVLHHVTPAPAADPNWTSAGWLVALGLAAATAGIAAFQRRDLAGA